MASDFQPLNVQPGGEMEVAGSAVEGRAAEAPYGYHMPRLVADPTLGEGATPGFPARPLVSLANGQDGKIRGGDTPLPRIPESLVRGVVGSWGRDRRVRGRDAEPRFIRRERPSRIPESLLYPRCPLCDTPLKRLQKMWCSASCRVTASRARRDLDRYWETASCASTGSTYPAGPAN